MAMTWTERIRRLTDRARMAWKRGLSFRKRTWEFEDYPMWVREQGPSLSLPPRFVSHRYRALITGWLVSGSGDTRAEALADLRNQFERRRQLLFESGEPIPRPGTRVPIKIAGRIRLDSFADLEADFIRRVLTPVLGVEDVMMTDGSSLWNFHFDENSSALVAKIGEVYGVDVSDIESENIAEILERIAASRRADAEG